MPANRDSFRFSSELKLERFFTKPPIYWAGDSVSAAGASGSARNDSRSRSRQVHSPDPKTRKIVPSPSGIGTSRGPTTCSSKQPSPIDSRPLRTTVRTAPSGASGALATGLHPAFQRTTALAMDRDSGGAARIAASALGSDWRAVETASRGEQSPAGPVGASLSRISAREKKISG